MSPFAVLLGTSVSAWCVISLFHDTNGWDYIIDVVSIVANAIIGSMNVRSTIRAWFKYKIIRE